MTSAARMCCRSSVAGSFLPGDALRRRRSYLATVEFSKWEAASLSMAAWESNFEASTRMTAVFLIGSVLISTTPGSGESVSFTSMAQPAHVIPGMFSDTKVVFDNSPASPEIDKSDDEVLLDGPPPPLGAGVHPAASTTSNAGNQ